MPNSDHEQFVNAIAALKKIPLKKLRNITNREQLPTPNHTSDYKSSSNEHISYKSNGIQHKAFAKLKKGTLKPEATIDLHGKTKDQAASYLQNFIINCQRENIKNALVIHGKGDENNPILKNYVATLLKNSTEVLAFSSAKPEDGGTGALYMSLKRKN